MIRPVSGIYCYTQLGTCTWNESCFYFVFVLYLIVVLISIWCWAYFHVLNNQLYIFLAEISIQVICPVFNWLFVFLLLNCRGSLFWIQVLYQIHDLQIFSTVLLVVFSFSWCVLWIKMFLIWIKSKLYSFFCHLWFWGHT